MIDNLSARVEQLVNELLDEAAKKPRADLIADLALPLPLTVISEMLGVPEKDRMLFRNLMGRLAEDLGTASLTSLLFSYPISLRLERFFRDLVKLRREQPGDDLRSSERRREGIISTRKSSSR